MIVKPVGHANGFGWHVRLSVRLRLGPLNASFDFPHVIEILAQPPSVVGSEPGLEILEVADHKIKNAPVGTHARQPLLGRGRRRRTSARTERAG